MSKLQSKTIKYDEIKGKVKNFYKINSKEIEIKIE